MMKTWADVVLRTAIVPAALALASCGGGAQATSSLESRSGSTTTGTAVFEADGDQVTLTLNVSGTTPGKHGAHIHQMGDCSAADASSAGGHWNPTSRPHGPAGADHHLGDLGNIEIGQDGKGTLKLSKTEWKIGDGSANDVVGKALIIHSGEDDLVTDPAGSSGSRGACGVIAQKE